MGTAALGGAAERSSADVVLSKGLAMDFCQTLVELCSTGQPGAAVSTRTQVPVASISQTR